MNINEVHWNFSDNGNKEPAKSRFWNFYNFWTAWKFLMRFSLLCSGEWALSFYICVFIYIGVSLRFRTENRIVKDSFSVFMCCYARYSLKICSERWNKVLNICTCNISVICTEMTNIHDDMIGLWQLLYICKAEKTHLNHKVVLGGLCV